MPSPLKEKDLELINQQLADLELIKADLERAKAAGIPNIDELLARHCECVERCTKIKQQYFPTMK